MTAFFARHALLPDGWARDVRIEADASRAIVSITAASLPAGATQLEGIVLPGVPNAHSHAFQRAMAGTAEVASGNEDSFWTWREAMYASIATLGPDEFEAVTTAAFVAMRRAGYTHVCEFHYVHNAPDGSPYDDPNELAHRVVAAAKTAGIGLTLLPVLYRFSDFGAVAPVERQRRFIRSTEHYLAAWSALRARYAGDPLVALGMAPHSLRAVAPDDLKLLVAEAARHGPVPMHVHISEQRREVEACRATHGTTPIELLTHTIPLAGHWCLVHATHATPSERDAIVRAGAVVALCPTTEANLGDGIFPAAEFTRAGGRIAVGSDSNVAIDLAEELRWLEYVQRLRLERRNALHDRDVPQVARYAYARCASGGAQASGATLGRIAAGYRCDLLALDDGGESDPDLALSRAVFVSGAWNVRASVVGATLTTR